MCEDFDPERGRKFLAAADARPNALTRRLARLEDRRAIQIASPAGQKIDLNPLPAPLSLKADAEVPDGRALLS